MGATSAAVALLVTAVLGIAASFGAAPASRPAAPAAQRLSLAQLAGQRIIFSYRGPDPPASLLARIRRGEAAGVILFSPNIQGSAQIRAVIARLQAAAAGSPVHAPLLILTDQEGGLVRRFAGAPQLSEKQIGAAAGATRLAAQAGDGAGRNLAAARVSVNLAPVLDVFRTAGGFDDQYGRSYSSDPRTVAQLGAAFIAAQQRTRVAATAKHFPGLGAAGAAQDTDAGPVTLGVSRGELRSVDELPYRAAIAAGVKLVMTSWARYPALDAGRPAGLSPTVIGGELRGRLGFRGVTITDGLGAGALSPYGGMSARAAAAAIAGADLLVCSAPNVNKDTPEDGFAAQAGIVAALRAGKLPRADAERAVMRVLALRSGQ